MKRYLKYLIILTLVAGVLIAAVVSVIHFLTKNTSDAAGWFFLKELGYSSAIALTIVSLCLLVWFKLERALSWSKGMFRKVILSFLASALITNAMTVIWVLLLHALLHYPGFVAQLLKNLLISNIAHAILFLVLESTLLFRRWRLSYIGEQEAKRALVQSRYDNLKRLLRPHFLFNSLNVLIPLIETAPEKAIAFVNQFSTVYRYVLDVHEESAVPLEGELMFLKAYVDMLQTLHGEALLVSIRVDGILLTGYLPPFSLQLVVENAVKHNRVSKSVPLCIDIVAENERLVVTNNLQRIHRLRRVSAGMGHRNLMERYRLLGGPLPIFEETNDRFVCKLPILMEVG